MQTGNWVTVQDTHLALVGSRFKWSEQSPSGLLYFRHWCGGRGFLCTGFFYTPPIGPISLWVSSSFIHVHSRFTIRTLSCSLAVGFPGLWVKWHLVSPPVSFMDLWTAVIFSPNFWPVADSFGLVSFIGVRMIVSVWGTDWITFSCVPHPLSVT